MAKKEQSDIQIEDYVAKAQEMRAQMAKEIADIGMDKTEIREEFRKFFMQLQHQMKLDRSLEFIIWKHLESIECNKVDKFQEGIAHFGIKVK